MRQVMSKILVTFHLYLLPQNLEDKDSHHYTIEMLKISVNDSSTLNMCVYECN